MAAKPKASSRAAVPPITAKAQAACSPPASLTMEERLHRIEAMRERIDGYIRFMCQIATMSGTSGEVKERAIAVFYEQMLTVEKQLGRIHDEFRLE